MDVFQIIYLSEADAEIKISNKYLLYYVLKGRFSLRVGETEYKLEQDDYMLVNNYQLFQLQNMTDSLVLCLEIDSEVFQNSDRGRVVFYCCSVNGNSVKYDKFRYVFGELLSELALDPVHLSLSTMSALYKICDYLMKHFSLVEREKRLSGDQKMRQILEFVNYHYKEKITLETMANQCYMSPTAFSRYFSRATGEPFIGYVNKVRIQHASMELLTTNQSVSEIALNNGFGSIPQFNKTFKAITGLAPREYRQLTKEERVDEELLKLPEVEAALDQFKSITRHVVVREQKIKLQSIKVNTTQGRQFNNSCGEMINLGFASRVLSAEYQTQILYMKRFLKVKEVVINGLFSPEMKLIDKDKNTLNFVRIDQILDFLTNNELCPWIVLDNQCLNMLKELNQTEGVDSVCLSDNFETITEILGLLMDHFVFRYGMEEVETWKFSLWHDTLRNSTMGISGKFYKQWDQIYELIKRKIPNSMIGGCGYSATEKEEDMRNFFEAWKNSEYKPDFLSFSFFPYNIEIEGRKLNAGRRKVDDFFSEEIAVLKNILKAIDFPKIPIVATEWNLSFVQRNAFNDMSGKAAIMLKQMIGSAEDVARISYWPASDLYAEDYDADKILNGACGLISTNGICKPMYHGIGFFRSLYKILVSRGENYIITKDGMGHFEILLCNPKHLNHNYYSKPESSINNTDVNSIFDDWNPLEVTLELDAVEDREYTIRYYKINSQEGSALDEWLRLGEKNPMTAGDLNYLRNRSMPHRRNEQRRSERNILTIQEILEPHEILRIQIL